MLKALVTLTGLAAAATLAAGAPARAAGAPCGLTGAFRIYSSALVYKSGGTGVAPPEYQRITLSGNAWQFGKSRGRFAVAPISAADWKRWGTRPYGPTTKIVLSGWNHGTADGPIETETHAVDFFWVIYSVGPPTISVPGTVELKFGHVVVPKSCP